MRNPYTTDELIRHLQFFWAKAEGLDYGPEHEVMKCAAERLQRLSAHCLRLERKIHNQRHMCRLTWDTIEMRNGWRIHTQEVRSKMLKYWCAASRELKELKESISHKR